MRVLVTGGTGFIGTAVCRALRGAGHAVKVVSRGKWRTATEVIDPESMPPLR